VGVVRRYMNNPRKENWEEVKWILRYLISTDTHALCFGGSYTVLQGYVDSYIVGDKDRRRSTKWYVFIVGGTKVLDFKTIKGCCTFNNKSRVCCCYRG
jgi:hypothetical protein